MRQPDDVLRDIASFHPSLHAESAPGREWLALDALVVELSQVQPPPQGAAGVLMRVFETFPRHDGFGVFWSVLHLIESIPGFEEEVLASVQRKPTEMGVTMLNRLLNHGTMLVRGTDLRLLIQQVEPFVPQIDLSV